MLSGHSLWFGGVLILETLDSSVGLAPCHKCVRVILYLRFMPCLHVVEGRPRPLELGYQRMLLSPRLIPLRRHGVPARE